MQFDCLTIVVQSRNVRIDMLLLLLLLKMKFNLKIRLLSVWSNDDPYFTDVFLPTQEMACISEHKNISSLVFYLNWKNDEICEFYRDLIKGMTKLEVYQCLPIVCFVIICIFQPLNLPPTFTINHLTLVSRPMTPINFLDNIFCVS